MPGCPGVLFEDEASSSADAETPLAADAGTSDEAEKARKARELRDRAHPRQGSLLPQEIPHGPGFGVRPDGVWRRAGAKGGRPDLTARQLDLAFQAVHQHRGRAWTTHDTLTMQEVAARCLNEVDLGRFDIPIPKLFLGEDPDNPGQPLVPKPMQRFLAVVWYAYWLGAFGVKMTMVAFAACCGCSERTVRRYRKLAVATGLLRRGFQTDDKDEPDICWREGKGERPVDQDSWVFRLGPKLEAMALVQSKASPPKARDGSRAEPCRRAKRRLSRLRAEARRAERDRHGRMWQQRQAHREASERRRLNGTASGPSRNLNWAANLSDHPDPPPLQGGRGVFEGKQQGTSSPETPVQDRAPSKTASRSAAPLDSKSPSQPETSPPNHHPGPVALRSKGFSGPPDPESTDPPSSARADAVSELMRNLSHLTSAGSDRLRSALGLSREGPPSSEVPSPPPSTAAAEAPPRPKPSPRPTRGRPDSFFAFADMIRQGAQSFGVSTTLLDDELDSS